MIQQQVTVLYNQKVGPDCYRLGLSCRQGYGNAVPGQFVMVQTSSDHTPLLRRPFSIFGLIGSFAQPEGIELLYQVVGPGTGQMARFATGQTIDVLGPLGNGFKVDAAHRRIYMAAGGIGVAPIRFLAVYLMDLGVGPDCCHLFLGAQSQESLYCQQDFKDMGIEVALTTDDGSAGDQCLITDPLELAIEKQVPDMVYTCGPHGMLQCVAGIVAKHGVACQISMETMMACGMGACLGCAIPATDGQRGYLHVCREGPVFRADQIAI